MMNLVVEDLKEITLLIYKSWSRHSVLLNQLDTLDYFSGNGEVENHVMMAKDNLERAQQLNAKQLTNKLDYFINELTLLKDEMS